MCLHEARQRYKADTNRQKDGPDSDTDINIGKKIYYKDRQHACRQAGR